jgi:hypothetical protein
VRFELDQVHRDHAKIENGLERAEAASERGGRASPWIPIAELRARYQASTGDVTQALATLGALRLRPPSDLMPRADMSSEHELLLLAEVGRHSEAIALARRLVTREEKLWRTPNVWVAEAHSALAAVLARAGDERGALEEAKAAATILDSIHADAKVHDAAAIATLGHAARLGRTDILGSLPDVVASLALPDGAADRWVAALVASERAGFIELTAEILRQAPDTTDFVDARAFRAYRIGDDATMQKEVPRALALAPGTLNNSLWIQAVLDARAGNRTAAMAARDHVLRELSSAPDGDKPILLFLAAIVDDALGRHAEAAAGLERAYDASVAWTMTDINVPMLSALLGQARMRTGHAEAAIESLQIALEFALGNPAGFDYEMPDIELALAQALWETNRDRPRARYLANHAAQGFARLGAGKERERQEALRWAAAH